MQGHPEFNLYFDEYVIDPWVEWFVDYLENSVQTEKYADEETMQVGWMINLIKSDDGALTIYEPDFKRIPVNWTKSVSTTLSHIFLQRYVADSIGLTERMNFPSYIQTAIRCNSFGGDPVGFCITRFEPSDTNRKDSGWFLGCLDPKHDHNSPQTLSLISLFEAATINKFIVPYLALPPQVNIIEIGDPNGFEIALGNDVLPIKEGSYLEKWLQDRRVRDAAFQRTVWNS